MLFVGTPAPNRSYWIEVRASDAQGSPNLKAKIDRATNTITVEGEGVPKFTVYFNDVLLDLDKPVTTTCGSGVAASILLFAMNLLGKEDTALYDGSWSEWGAAPGEDGQRDGGAQHDLFGDGL